LVVLGRNEFYSATTNFLFLFSFSFPPPCKEEIGPFEGGLKLASGSFFKNVPGSESSHFHKTKHHKYSNISRLGSLLGLSFSKKETTDPRKGVLD